MKLILVVSLLLFAVIPIRAGDVTLAWDAPADEQGPIPGVAGYRMYYGTASAAYDSTLTLGIMLECTVTNLASTKGAMYYFAVTALYEGGQESDFSNEVQTYVPHPYENPVAAPQITGSVQ